jgi:hypothetical protein
VTTTNLDITYIDPAVADKTVIANEAFDDFDGALAGYDTTTMVIPTDANLDLSASALPLRSLAFEVTSSVTLGATRNVIVPDNPKIYFIYNNTTGTQSVQIITSAGTGATVAKTKRAIVYCDGTNVDRYSADQ